MKSHAKRPVWIYMCTQEEVAILAKTKTIRQKRRLERRIRRLAGDKLARLMVACEGKPKGRNARQVSYFRKVAGA